MPRDCLLDPRGLAMAATAIRSGAAVGSTGVGESVSKRTRSAKCAPCFSTMLNVQIIRIH